jgi:hypothetical protein
MSRKTTAYARKRHAQGKPIGVVNAAAWHNAIERCQPLGETAPIVQGIKRATDPYALLIEARDALVQMLDHTVAPSNPAQYDCLACVVDVTWLRALQIDRNPDTNPWHADLVGARTVLHSMRSRWERLGKWGMAGPERDTMKTAVDHYEAILLASSAEQMMKVEDERNLQIARGNFYTPEAHA